MKIETKRLKEEFQPIEVKVTIQTEYELQSLLAFFSRDVSIPDHFKHLLGTQGDETYNLRNFISDYMNQFHNVLVEQATK